MSAQVGQSARMLTPGVGWSLASTVVLSTWLGAALFFSAVAAPALFRVLPSRTLAGAVVGRTLPVLFVAGIVIGLLVALLTWPAAAPQRLRLAVSASAIAMASLCAIAQFVIGARISRLRASLQSTLEALPPNDPARLEFGRLHGYAVMSLGAAMLLAVFAVAALATHLAWAASTE